MNILITGTSGYLGNNLVNYLHKISSYKLFALVRTLPEINSDKDIAFFKYNGSYQSVLAAFQAISFDLVIHCAAQAQYFVDDNLDQQVDGNLKFATQLLEAMRVTDTNKIINTGSYWQNDEMGNYNPNCLYAALKKATEDVIDYYVKRWDISAITLRLMDVYGTNDPRNKLFPALINAIANSEKKFGLTKAEQLLDFTYIDDVVNAFHRAILLLEQPQYKSKHQIYYVSSGETIELKKAVNLLLELANSTLEIGWGEKPYRKHEIMLPYVGEILPTWSPKVTLKEGLQRLLSARIMQACKN